VLATRYVRWYVNRKQGNCLRLIAEGMHESPDCTHYKLRHQPVQIYRSLLWAGLHGSCVSVSFIWRSVDVQVSTAIAC
jgi:hypothetical protein